MIRMAFDRRFINAAGDGLVDGKIHTIRRNYDWWKRFEGREVALFYWDGKPYRSKQKAFCVKRIVSVQEVYFYRDIRAKYGMFFSWPNHADTIESGRARERMMAENDGFANIADFYTWFLFGDYKPGKMAAVHFTDFRY
jgi:hypothetical protein